MLRRPPPSPTRRFGSATLAAGLRPAFLLVVSLVWNACGDDTGSSPEPEPDPQLSACVPPELPLGTPAWGAPCQTVEDCPNPTVPTTFCEGSTGGYCTELSGPDWGGEGQPCSSDANSVGYVIGIYQQCLAACSADGDCRPGYHCATGLGSGGSGRACLAIDDCATRGCNDAAVSEPYYCDAGSSPQACWIDRCAGSPCAGDDYSTGSCSRVGDVRQCACVAGEYWDPDCQRCGGIVCDAEDLGRLETYSASTSADTCAAEARFNPTASGCTGYNAHGPDRTYQVTLAPQTGATFTATPTTAFDLSLYVVEGCFDFTASTCLFGEDAAGAEVAVVANDSDEDKTVIAVVDGAQPSSCGTFDLTVEPFAFVCGAEDLGTFNGTPITRSGENNCANENLYNPGLGGCTGAHAAGREKVYRLTLAPGVTATVTMDPTTGFDAELWETRRCGDFGGAECTTSSDVGGAGALEAITVTNSGSSPATHFIVADSFNIFAACGDYDLLVD